MRSNANVISATQILYLLCGWSTLAKQEFSYVNLMDYSVLYTVYTGKKSSECLAGGCLEIFQ